MISKERLEELIKEGATIWVRNDYQTYEINTSYFVNIDIIDNILYCGAEMVCLDYLYETKEQANWALKYHATRTEELDLPMWEEFIKEDNTVVKFWKNGHKITLYKYIKNKKTNNIRIMILDDREDCECWKFNKPATEENYITACDLCLKLFKGEE